MNNIYHDVFINAEIMDIFQAISKPDLLINWWPLKCTGTAELNGEYNFFFTKEYDWFGKVCEIEENRKFFIRMTDADEDWNPTTFGFQLEQQEGGVMLSFSHMNWPENNHHFRRSSFCWALLLKGLKDYVEKGKILVFEDRG